MTMALKEPNLNNPQR